MKIVQLIALLVFSSLSLKGQNLKEGSWKGKVVYEDKEVPFLFKITNSRDALTVTFSNGSEQIVVNNAQITGDSIVIPMPVFDSEIRAKFTETTMSGQWKKGYRKNGVPFIASYNHPRFKALNKDNTKLFNKYSITFNPGTSQSYAAVGVFNKQKQVVTGTIMTTTGDWRYFEGITRADSLHISTFDGGHAFLIEAKLNKDSIQGVVYMDKGYAEPFKGVKNEGASLSDPFGMTRVKKHTYRPYWDILTKKNTLTPSIDPEADFFDKVVVIQLFGTWCPNSKDQTNYLVQWYQKNSSKPVSLLSVSYEANFSMTYGLSRLEAYKNEMNIQHPIGLGGPLNKGNAALAFPFISKVNAFPTLIIIDRLGYIRYVHSYFNGPATNEYYTQFDVEFNRIIDELIEEK